ncbi:GumC family protein [Lichenihabitans psoromatis]|uniref:GumC family protein n=1 Tax=Lichenihabitans psoromatis TaxID=2528642 RepID=UPI00103853FD|nr:Wzz/FepE/Etk N-terminal domain-containing protein [Lichenihabitans psoromatis]
MNMASPREFSRLVSPPQDLRAQYESDLVNIFRVLWSRKLLIASVTALVALAAIAAAVLLGRTYVGEALVELKFGTDSGAVAGTPVATVDALAVVEGEAEILRSRAVARRVLEQLERQGEAKSPTAAGSQSVIPSPKATDSAETIATDRKLVALQQGLTVKTDGKTYLVHVSYAAKDPVRAAMIANLFADEYLASRVEVSVDAARRTSDWLATQVAQAVTARERAAEAIRVFRQRADVIAANTANPQANEQQMRDLVSQMSAAQADQLRLEARLQRLTAAAAAGQTPSALDLQGSTDAQRLIDAEVTARQEASRLVQMIGTKHPLYIRAEKTLEAARQQLVDAVAEAIRITQADIDSMRSSQAALDKQLAALKNAALGSQMFGNHMRSLEADETTAQANLDRLREALRQAQALTQLKPIAAQLVSSAEPLALPASPRLILVAILGTMAGFGASLLLVFLLHLRDTGFSTSAEAARDLGIACAGMLPRRMKADQPQPRPIYLNAMKALAITSGLAEPRDGCVVVVVTSARPGEGKTDLVRGLATALGALQRRVLIVENAGRREVGRPDGAAGQQEPERIAGSAVSLYHRTSDDLSAIVGCRDRLQPWIDKVGSHFDVMIVEAPAILSDPEALLIARSANLVLFAVQWRSTPRQAAASAFQQLTPAPGQSAMVVLTDVDLAAHRHLGKRDQLYFAGRYAARNSAPA